MGSLRKWPWHPNCWSSRSLWTKCLNIWFDFGWFYVESEVGLSDFYWSFLISLKCIVISSYYVGLFKSPIQFRTIAPQRFNDTSIITSLSSCLLAFFMLKKSYGKIYSYGFFFSLIVKVLLLHIEVRWLNSTFWKTIFCSLVYIDYSSFILSFNFSNHERKIIVHSC